jgi:acetyl esterase/lipase
MIDPYRFAPWVSAEAAALFRAEAEAPPAPDGDIAALRLHYDAFNRRHLATAMEHYPVDIVREEIAGVPVDVVTPVGGATGERTLVCLHGGGFMWGRGAGALLEAVPVAATSGMRVIAVEYALAPERIFPVAVEQVLAVFAALSAKQQARSIGIYGCSAGGVLTAQSVARMIADGVALPGAIAMLCGTGLEMLGDSAATAGIFAGQPESAEAPNITDFPYFAGTDVTDPLVIPGNHPDMLARFPPSLLVSGTRDFAASSVAVMHRRLLAAGADASLLMFDGMWHAHHMATTLPEARETFAALARFFDSRLA